MDLRTRGRSGDQFSPVSLQMIVIGADQNSKKSLRKPRNNLGKSDDLLKIIV